MRKYYLGAFLVGAYQETLGDLHNLLGDRMCCMSAPGRMAQSNTPMKLQAIRWPMCSHLWNTIREMVNRVRRQAEQAVRQGRSTAEERHEIMLAYEAGMRGYTYFEK